MVGLIPDRCGLTDSLRAFSFFGAFMNATTFISQPQGSVKDKRNWAWLFTAVGFLVLGVILFADALTLAESLLSGYPKIIAYAFSVAIILAIDFICWAFWWSVANCFAFKYLSRPSFLMYVWTSILCLAVLAYCVHMVTSNIAAVGMKRRQLLNPYDYSKNAALVYAERGVTELERRIRSIDSTVFAWNLSAKSASDAFAAAMAARGDSAFNSKKVSVVNRAARAQSMTLSGVTQMSKQSFVLQTALLAARDRRDAVRDSLDKLFAGKSAEDVVEASMGMDLKRQIAYASQFLAGVIIWLLVFKKWTQSGKIEYWPLAFVSAHDSGLPERTGSNGNGSVDEGFRLPVVQTDDLEAYRVEVVKMFIRGEFGSVTQSEVARKLEISPVKFTRLKKSIESVTGGNEN